MRRSEVDETLGSASAAILDGAPEPLLLQRKRLDRAQRFETHDLPSRCTLATPNGFIVRMVNVSETGILFESPLKFTRDSETAFSLLSPDTTRVLPARIVRSEVATVNGVGVTYQTAAHFSETLDLVKNVRRLPKASPTSFHRYRWSRRRRHWRIYWCASRPSSTSTIGATRRERAFEAGLRQLVPTCDIMLCDRLVQPYDGGESIYFAVPGASGVHGASDVRARTPADDRGIQAAQGSRGDGVGNRPRRNTLAPRSPYPPDARTPSFTI